MAALVIPSNSAFRSTRIRASGDRRSDASRRKSSSNWWTPLFGWSSEPDYISDIEGDKPRTAPENDRTGNGNPNGIRSKFAPGCFTEEKAKQLRKKTMETATFHDIMYHSAIASRLASNLTDNSDL